MAEKKTEGFDFLIDYLSQFVERQKGIWDHNSWVEFLTDIQKQGFELTDDVKDFIGSLLESMKKTYESITDTEGIEKVISKISKLTMDFIKKTNGIWGHSEWEMLLNDIQKEGINLTDETMAYIGGILESANKIYAVLPPPISKKAPKKTVKKSAKKTKTAK